MASIKSTLWTIWVVGLLFLMVAGLAFGWGWWKQRAILADLALAETKLNEGKPIDAELLLAERLDRDRPTGAWVDHALELRFAALTQLVDTTPDAKQKAPYLAKAQLLADRILDPNRPLVRKTEPAWARAHLVLAQAALGSDKAEPAKIAAAKPHIDAVLSLPDGASGREEAVVYQCALKMTDGKVSEAQKDLEALMGKMTEETPVRLRTEKMLGKCNWAILMSPPLDEKEIYVLQKGDTFDRLRRKFHISADVLMSINQISDPRRLTIGRRIKIPDLSFSIVVNKADNTLTLYNHGKFFKKYSVRTGKVGYMTPVGDFRIISKIKDPPWHNPKDGKSYAGGEPGNELGCRWMGFQGSNLGIHEAVDAATVGANTSNGCVGMVKEDAIELFDLVPQGTPLKIMDKKLVTPVVLPAADVGVPILDSGPAVGDGAGVATDPAAPADAAPATKKAAPTKKARSKTAKTTKKKT